MGSTRIVIRGNGSFGNNQPLYIVDGMPIDNSNYGQPGLWGGVDGGDGISSLNSDDIEFQSEPPLGILDHHNSPRKDLRSRSSPPNQPPLFLLRPITGTEKKESGDQRDKKEYFLHHDCLIQQFLGIVQLFLPVGRRIQCIEILDRLFQLIQFANDSGCFPSVYFLRNTRIFSASWIPSTRRSKRIELRASG